ncbi:hypothetical protein JW826_03655 [Candidatus Woesearchaeota archaeon]|nr:hypothetical protein [Candidatus Woesearchaeota archaeon]
MAFAIYAVILVSILGIAAYLRFARKGYREVLLAALMTGAWVGFSGLYNYKGTPALLSLAFPFFAWTGGLLLLKIIHDRMGRYRFAKAVVMYETIFLLAEYVFYNFLGVQLDSNYPGLFGLPLLHAPAYAQAYCLLVAPAYLLLLMQIDKYAEMRGSKRKIFNRSKNLLSR